MEASAKLRGLSDLDLLNVTLDLLDDLLGVVGRDILGLIGLEVLEAGLIIPEDF